MEFQELLPLPPMLPTMANINVSSRWTALCYWGSKPTWSDGRASATFSFHSVWKPLIEHPTLAIHLYEADLGSDDSEATHCLVLDQKDQKLHLASLSAAKQLLQSSQEQLDIEAQDWDFEKAVAEVPTRVGMFEMFGAQSQTQRLEMVNLIRWLDHFLTQELIEHYLELARQGNWQALWTLQQLRQRLEASPD